MFGFHFLKLQSVNLSIYLSSLLYSILSYSPLSYPILFYVTLFSSLLFPSLLFSSVLFYSVLSICLRIYLQICLSVYLPLCLPSYTYIYIYIYLSKTYSICYYPLLQAPPSRVRLAVHSQPPCSPCTSYGAFQSMGVASSRPSQG